MRDYLKFKDELLEFLYEFEKTNPSQYTDINEFIDKYDRRKYCRVFSDIINELYSPDNQGVKNSKITSLVCLDKYTFHCTELMNKSHKLNKIRITPIGIDYIESKKQTNQTITKIDQSQHFHGNVENSNISHLSSDLIQSINLHTNAPPKQNAENKSQKLDIIKILYFFIGSGGVFGLLKWIYDCYISHLHH